MPSRLGEELETNPFLRPSSAAIREALGAHSAAVPASAQHCTATWAADGTMRPCASAPELQPACSAHSAFVRVALVIELVSQVGAGRLLLVSTEAAELRSAHAVVTSAPGAKHHKHTRCDTAYYRFSGRSELRSCTQAYQPMPATWKHLPPSARQRTMHRRCSAGLGRTLCLL